MVSPRRLEPADAAAYRALMLEGYGRHPDAFSSSAAERAALPLSWWEERLDPRAEAASVVFGAVQDGELAGVVGLVFESREKLRHKSTLFGMYVRPGFRKAGLGRQLVLAALEEARSRPGVQVVQLSVTHGNDAALALYERCGFTPFGLEPLAVAVGSELVAKVHMWLDLRLSPRAPAPDALL